MKYPSIPKGNLFNYSFYTSNRSRDFFFYCLINLKKCNINKIFVPSYLGGTSIEESGIMDAIIDSKVDYIFYPINENLRVNKNTLLSMMKEMTPGSIALLFIHYFGFIDPSYFEVTNLSKEKKFFIFDDCAHSYYTYYKYKHLFKGDAAYFSIHKLIKDITPESISLIQEDNNKIFHPKITYLLNGSNEKENYNPLNRILNDRFDFFPAITGINEIIQKRISQVNIYIDILDKSKFPFKILITDENKNFPLQSFPILFSEKINRDEIFHEMRKLDIQVVSLYYSLSNKINKTEFPESYNLSKKILNLPINEELEKEDIIYICTTLLNIITEKYTL